MTELKPCPFCGGEARHYAPGPIEHHIECTNPKCYAVTHGWTTEAEAIAAWNNRTLGSDECMLVYGEDEHGYDGWWCQSCGGWFAASFRRTARHNIIEPSYCQHCGKAVKR